MRNTNWITASAMAGVLVVAAAGCAVDSGRSSSDMTQQSTAGLGEPCANGIVGTPNMPCAEDLVCVYPDDTTSPTGPGGSSSAATGTCQQPDESCAADQYGPRRDHMTAWLVSCTSEEHGQFYTRLQEMEHPTEGCPYRYQLMGEEFDTADLALSANSCDGSCLYFPTYSEWIAHCGGMEDIQVYQVPPEDWMPLDPIPPVPGCPDLFLSPRSHEYYLSIEEAGEAPCPE